MQTTTITPVISQLADRMVSMLEDTEKLPTGSYEALDRLSLYSGLSGIAASLPKEILETAFPATFIDRLLSRIEHELKNEPDAFNSALFGGTVGLALCALEIVQHHTWHEWRERIAAAFTPDRCEAMVGATARNDFANGIAGIGWAFVLLQKKGIPIPEKFIHMVGDKLLERIESAPIGFAIREPQMSAVSPPCGIAHGSSGYACALAEIGVHLRDDKFIHISKHLLNYDLSLRTAAHNWPEFRVLRRDPADLVPRKFSNRGVGGIWCYGAPGIYLAIRHCSILTQSEQLFKLYKVAAGHYLRSFDRLSDRRDRELCVCHGLGSAMAIYRTFTHDFPEAEFPVFRAELEYLSILLNHESLEILRSRFPSALQEKAADAGAAAQLGYFTGVSGLLDVVLGTARRTLQLPVCGI